MDGIDLESPTVDDILAFWNRPRAGCIIARRKDCKNLYNFLVSITAFLPDTATPTQRYWHVKNDLYEYPMCLTCNHKHRPFDAKTTLTYAPNCQECGRRIGRENAKAALLERYGVEHVSHVPGVAEKRIATNLIKYGASNPMMDLDVRARSKVTNLKKYGTEYASQSDVVKERARESFQKKYNRPAANQNKISDESWDMLHSPEGLKVLHHDDKMPLNEIAHFLQVDPSTVSDYFHKHGIPIQRFKCSFAEREIQQLLESVGIQVEYRNRDIISTELDMFIPSHNLAIEYHGIYWHSEARWDEQRIHYEKYVECKSKGIRLIQIFEDEWNNKADIIKSKLLSILGKSNSQSVYARKCKTVTVSTKDKSTFFETNHIQGDGPSSINYGLEYNGALVAVVGFIRQKDHFILNRYATSCNVPGGFTKLVTHFEKEYSWPVIVTFADLRWSEGDLYSKNGFALDKELKPDYYWVKGCRRWHKFNWRHTSGLKDLPNYDPELTEVKNMHNHNYHRIWDAGKLRFVRN